VSAGCAGEARSSSALATRVDGGSNDASADVFEAAAADTAGDGPIGDGPAGDDSADVADTPVPITAVRTGIPVLEHHGSPSRSGVYVVPGLTRASASSLALDPLFHASYPGVAGGEGNVNAQPLYVPHGVGDADTLYVVTENNDVLALDERDGHTVWSVNLGPPATEETAVCTRGAFPLGITGTPVIDLPSRTLYVDATLSQDGALFGTRDVASHVVHALSLDDGTERSGWPFDPRGITANGNDFDASVAHQRGALALVHGTLFIPHGSMGDCGDYRGWILAVPTADPTTASGWAVAGPQAGIWSPNGVASDGDNLFFATGNGGSDGESSEWGGGEGVFRLAAQSPIAASPDDAYHPENWQDLDAADQDLGGSGAIPFSIPGATPSRLVVAAGKDGNLYLLDAANLSVPVAVANVATANIVVAPAVFPNAEGALVVLDAMSGGVGTHCPDGQSGDLVAVQIARGSPPTVSTKWCAQNGYGSPIVTTTDGTSEAIVWVTSMTGGVLHAYDAATGARLFEGPGAGALQGAYRFNTIIPTAHHLVIAANTSVYAFSLP
jgi:outer membrane protein assembly factor BamB